MWISIILFPIFWWSKYKSHYFKKQGVSSTIVCMSNIHLSSPVWKLAWFKVVKSVKRISFLRKCINNTRLLQNTQLFSSVISNFPTQSIIICYSQIFLLSAYVTRKNSVFLFCFVFSKTAPLNYSRSSAKGHLLVLFILSHFVDISLK